jgi:hypothetical protein
MMDLLTQLQVWLTSVLAPPLEWLNVVLAPPVVWLIGGANLAGSWLLAFVAVWPGWLSATLIGVVTGALFLVLFKYTSPQRAIKRVRDEINANLLALKLYKDNVGVVVRAQGRIFLGALRLLFLALVPLSVLALPAALILGQMALWYQQRPLQVGEDTVVTLKLNGDGDAPLPEVRLQPTDAVETLVGPVRVPSKREICWNIQAREAGCHRLVFQVGDQTIDKELAIGDGFMRVSVQRPERICTEALEHPWEQPFGPDSPVRSIDIVYPPRLSWTSGTDWWLAYAFVVWMITGLCLRRPLNVSM